MSARLFYGCSTAGNYLIRVSGYQSLYTVCQVTRNTVTEPFPPLLASIKIHLRDLTLIAISRPGYHTVLVQGPAHNNGCFYGCFYGCFVVIVARGGI